MADLLVDGWLYGNLAGYYFYKWRIERYVKITVCTTHMKRNGLDIILGCFLFKQR